MREADVPAVLAIEKAGYPYPWPSEAFRRLLREGAVCWVLEARGAVRGYGIMRLLGEWAHVMNICVSPPCRGRGFGRRMMQHLLALARQHGARAAWLEVRPSNRTAILLYERLGFRKSSRRSRYYLAAGGGRQDALVMVLRWE